MGPVTYPTPRGGDVVDSFARSQHTGLLDFGLLGDALAVVQYGDATVLLAETGHLTRLFAFAAQFVALIEEVWLELRF